VTTNKTSTELFAGGEDQFPFWLPEENKYRNQTESKAAVRKGREYLSASIAFPTPLRQISAAKEQYIKENEESKSCSVLESFERALLVEDPLVSKFKKLAMEWKDSTWMYSSLTDMCFHPSYLQVIGMGSAIVPTILDDLQRSPHHWFIALEAITGQNPVGEDNIGDIEAMANDWVSWGRAKGII